MGSASHGSSSSFDKPRKNETISLKDRLSGFRPKYTPHNTYNSNLYGRDRYYERSSNYKSDRKFVQKDNIGRGSKFGREEERQSGDSDNSSDSNDAKDELKKRLNSFVSTSTIAKKNLSKI
jgi:hypothetical protein